jgi:membrane fusion protein, multidrug efflux system
MQVMEPRGPSEQVARPVQPKQQQQAPAKKRGNGSLLRWCILGIVLAAASIVGYQWWNRLQTLEETDDAYITGHSHPISFRVTGTVSEVLVDDNQTVKAGQPIARLDPNDYQVQLDQAQADLERANAQVTQSTAQVSQAEAQSAQADAQALAAKAKADDSKHTFDRNSQLFYQGKGVVSKQDLDNAQFQYEADQATYNASRAAVQVAHANVETAKAQRAAATAQLAAAKAAVENARLQLSYTVLPAPADGRIAKKSLETGQRVQPGQTVMAIVEPVVWVVANYKETQLGRIRPGQPVEVGVDAVKGRKFEGQVDSFQPGSGAVFALLPPDNATGNFTKIVQRVPVKILLKPESVKGYEQILVPGLSVTPAVRVK